MLGLASKGEPTLWHGFEPTRGAFGPSIVKTGRRTRRWATRLCSGREWRTGREFLPRRKELVVSSITWLNRKAAGSRSWRRRASACKDFARPAFEYAVSMSPG